ncbi:MAG: 50S ribosomal protein L11 methyltransferase [Clostridiales Family XIII bacterium]|jgi:ribosomal protein L11 methyltransferase|nr:50S ribosomal protein L11 methyltransferase [Clostridiales Family XIII bacterium]
MSGRFTETRVHTTTSGVEAVTALLLRRGVDGAAVEDSADIRAVADGKAEDDWDYIEPSLLAESEAGGEAVVSFYTTDDAAGRNLLAAIKIDLMKLKNDELCGAYGADADFGRVYAESDPLSDEWKDLWKEGFKPFRVSERFVICPPWDTPSAVGGAIVVIDPGMAFGTGSHETTSMCIRALEGAVRPGDRVWDIGTGSGILSVVSVLLGAEQVFASEIDADAVRAARANFERNGVADRIELTEGDVRLAPVPVSGAEGAEEGRCDTVVANLVKGLIEAILPMIAARLKLGGRLILSGLLERDEPAVRDALRAAGFSVDGSETKGEWLLLRASRAR